MSQVLLPFFGYIVLQLAVIVVGLNVVREKEVGTSGVLQSWIFGRMLVFAVLQVMAVPMILLRWKFSVLFWSYICVCAFLFGLGLYRIIKGRTKLRVTLPKLSPLALLLLMVAFLLILWQAGNYFFGIHLDEDDTRWLAEANDAIEYGHLIGTDYDTGELLTVLKNPYMKDVTSPWPMVYAVVSKILNIRTAVFAHTFYSPVAVFFMYSIYWLLGRELLRKNESKLAFVFFVAVINLFISQNGLTQSAFSLIRIWQGKATVAAIAIPAFLYLFIRVHKKNEIQDWIRIILVGFASCLMSGIGILVAAIMIGVYGGYDILAYMRWKRIPMYVFAVFPPIVYSIINRI